MTDLPPDELKRLRLAAHERAAVCGDCFATLAPTASVTMKERFVEHIPDRYDPLGHHIPARNRSERMPICLHCWLVDLVKNNEWDIRGMSLRGQDEAGPRLLWSRLEVRRVRCETCRRPMRVEVRITHRLSRRERCCCKQCLHTAVLRRNNERRRVHHQPIACAVCGTMFTPQKSNATTCSGKCRIKAYRARQKGEDQT